MSTFKLIPTSDGRGGHWSLGRDEAATLWYALDVYKAKLEASLTTNEAYAIEHGKGGSGYYEELMFVYEHLSKVTKLMFELRDNHPTDDDGNNEVRQWLDVT